MQQKIFPTDQLLKTTHYTYIEPKNQHYDSEFEALYEVSLLEKNDLIRLSKDMKLLCDGVVLKGEVKAVDSICYGWDDPFVAKPGTRLKSGADIIDGSCIFQVEEVLERSMLFQISEQINMAQSDSEGSDDGINALLKKLT